MQELDDIALLREYAERGSEEAFAQLVARHVNRVYSVALRHTKNPHQAEEITQTVFIILARKAGSLGKKVILEGWLYQTARLTALTAVRSEIRRTRREEESHMQNPTNETESEVWKQIEPLLDPALETLTQPDRHAIVLRFFYGKSMKEVGAAMGGTEGAATLRLRRALEKLRRFFLKRGVKSTAAVIAATISAHSAQAAPPALAKSVTTMAVAKGVVAGGSVPPLVGAVTKLLAWTKVKFALGVGAGVVLLAAGGTQFYAYAFHHRSCDPTSKSSRTHFPRSGWANEGFATPEAALNTFFWSSSAGELNVFMESGTQEFSQFMTNRMFRGRTEKERPAALAEPFKDLNGVTIDRKIEHPDGRVSLKLSTDGFSPFFSQPMLTMTNSDGKWKISVMRMRSGSAFKEFPAPSLLTEAEFTPRAGSELQGYWAGAIHTPRGDSPINLKIAEPTDNFFHADFKNVEQASLRPAWLTRDGDNVKFMLMWTVGGFEGKLRNGGKELEGKWIQGGREFSATLTKTNFVKP